jgi:hypothetical protein
MDRLPQPDYIDVLFAVIVVVIVIEVPMVSVVVRTMVVGDLAMISIPVARIILLPIVVGCHPACAGVSRAGPVSVMPLVVAAHRIPVSGYPGIVGSGASRLHPEDPNWWRRADSDSDGDLREDRSGCQQYQYG